VTPLDPDQEREVQRWRRARRRRPESVEPAGPGRESVWDYPRPPRVEPVALPVRVTFADRVVAASADALRVVETASPPTYYVPPGDVDATCLVRSAGATLCEWKGVAAYFTLRVDGRESRDAAWSYPEPLAPFEALRDHVAFYPGRIDACFVGEERVRPQPGQFYGGWVTSNLVGPFKGEPGSESW
jgi:uncharacterized protein (DUF427 family)